MSSMFAKIPLSKKGRHTIALRKVTAALLRYAHANKWEAPAANCKMATRTVRLDFNGVDRSFDGPESLGMVNCFRAAHEGPYDEGDRGLYYRIGVSGGVVGEFEIYQPIGTDEEHNCVLIAKLCWTKDPDTKVEELKRAWYLSRLRDTVRGDHLPQFIGAVKDFVEERVTSEGCANTDARDALNELAGACEKQTLQIGSAKIAEQNPLLLRVEWEMQSQQDDEGQYYETLSCVRVALSSPDGTEAEVTVQEDDGYDLSEVPDALLTALAHGAATDLTRKELEEAADKALPPYGELSEFAYEVDRKDGGTVWTFKVGLNAQQSA